MYIDGSVTEDLSGWGFAVKQVAITIYENSAAYTVSMPEEREITEQID